MGVLVLVRHGQSQWNLENRFTGWTDIPLTDRGRSDAALCATALTGYKFDCAFTSRLVRATETLDVILKELKQKDIEIIYDSALNERHYGDLQGLNKAETAMKYGEEQVQKWRRSYFTRPPGEDGESMEDCYKRTKPFFTHYILPRLGKNETILISAHGNSMRPIVQYIEMLEPEATAKLEFGLCTPYVYMFEGDRMVNKEVIEVEGIVTKGASIRELRVEEGRV